MSSALERFSVQVGSLTKTVKPFESWKGSLIEKYEVTFHLLTVGDLAEVARQLKGMAVEEMEYFRKIFVLSKSILQINGEQLVSEEDRETYNREHNLSGDSILSISDLKVLFFKQLNESIIQRLSFLYDDLQREYIKNHLGESLYDAIFTADSRFDAIMQDATQSLTADDTVKAKIETEVDNNDNAAVSTS